MFGYTPLRCHSLPTDVSKQAAVWVTSRLSREKVGPLVSDARPELKDMKHFRVQESKFFFDIVSEGTLVFFLWER